MSYTMVAPHLQSFAETAVENNIRYRFAPLLGLAVALTSAVCLALLIATTSPAGAATLEITPPLMHLGSFSTLDPIDNELMSGTTTISILSEQDWRLEVRLAGPIRLTGGALVLPLERALETHPYVPPEVLNLQPHVVKSGPGGTEPQEFTRDWLELQSVLQEYLAPGDPPGAYELTVLSRLVDATGSPLTDHVALTVQFDILPWVEISEAHLSDSRIPLDDGATEGESELVPLTLRSNTAWQLLVAGEGMLRREDGAIEFELATLSTCAEELTATSQTVRSGCVPLSVGETLVAEGSAPPAFSVAIVDVPLKFRFHGQPMIPIGTYRARVSLKARIVTRPP